MIRSLRLANFRLYEALEIAELSPGLNLFAGANWSGKSTILDAIAVGLTGTCRGADSGRGLDELRRRGSKRKWSVEIGWGSASLLRTEGDGPRSKAHEAIEHALGMPAEQVRACLYSGELMRLDKRGRQQLVLALARPAAVAIPEDLRVHGLPAEATLAEIEAS